MSETMEEKLDALIRSVAALSDSQKATLRDIGKTFKKFEEDMVASQDRAGTKES